MINPNELRIGNWVSRTDGVQVQLSNIGRKGTNIGPDEFPVCLEWEMFKPIELTPEILDKCGFEDREYTWEKDGIALDWSIRVISSNERQGISVVNHSHIKHLHQLQNIYHSLTGQELIYPANNAPTAC